MCSKTLEHHFGVGVTSTLELEFDSFLRVQTLSIIVTLYTDPQYRFLIVHRLSVLFCYSSQTLSIVFVLFIDSLQELPAHHPPGEPRESTCRPSSPIQGCCTAR